MTYKLAKACGFTVQAQHKCCADFFSFLKMPRSEFKDTQSHRHSMRIGSVFFENVVWE